MKQKDHITPSNLAGIGDVIGDLIFAQRRSKAQQTTNEQSWTGERTDALDDCKTIASCMESDPSLLSTVEDDDKTHERRGRSSRERMKGRSVQDGTDVYRRRGDGGRRMNKVGTLGNAARSGGPGSELFALSSGLFETIEFNILTGLTRNECLAVQDSSQRPFDHDAGAVLRSLTSKICIVIAESCVESISGRCRSHAGGSGHSRWVARWWISGVSGTSHRECGKATFLGQEPWRGGMNRARSPK